MTHYIHPKAICKSTRIWAFAHVLPGAQLGEDCNNCDHVFIENNVIVGSRVTVKYDVQSWDGLTLDDEVFVGPNAAFTNDPFPHSKQQQTKPTRTVVRHGGSIGAKATVLLGLEILLKAMIGGGTVILRSVPANANAIVVGNPGRLNQMYLAEVRSGTSNLGASPANDRDPSTSARGGGACD